jgi:hypothetical protein
LCGEDCNNVPVSISSRNMESTATSFRIGLILSGICLIAAATRSPVNAQYLTPILVSENGVGPLNGKTESSVRHIAALFPRLKVVAATDMSEGMEFPTVEVRDGRTVLLEILPEKDNRGIRGILIKSNKVKLRTGGQVGSRYSEIFGNKLSNQCEFGAEEYSDNVICDASVKSHISFIFEQVDREPNGELPSIDQIKSARVIEISWNPYRGDVP